MGQEISQCVEDMTGVLDVDIVDQSNREDGEVAAGQLWQRPSRSKLNLKTSSGSRALKVRVLSVLSASHRSFCGAPPALVLEANVQVPIASSSNPTPLIYLTTFLVLLVRVEGLARLYVDCVQG